MLIEIKNGWGKEYSLDIFLDVKAYSGVTFLNGPKLRLKNWITHDGWGKVCSLEIPMFDVKAHSGVTLK